MKVWTAESDYSKLHLFCVTCLQFFLWTCGTLCFLIAKNKAGNWNWKRNKAPSKHMSVYVCEKRKKEEEKHNWPPSVALLKMCFYISAWWRCTAGVPVVVPEPIFPQQANNRQVICTCSNYYPISNKYCTITGSNPHSQAAADCENPGREKLAGSSNGSDQTAINQQWKHLSTRRMLTESQQALALMERADEPGEVGGYQRNAERRF